MRVQSVDPAIVPFRSADGREISIPSGDHQARDFKEDSVGSDPRTIDYRPFYSDFELDPLIDSFEIGPETDHSEFYRGIYTREAISWRIRSQYSKAAATCLSAFQSCLRGLQRNRAIPAVYQKMCSYFRNMQLTKEADKANVFDESSNTCVPDVLGSTEATKSNAVTVADADMLRPFDSLKPLEAQRAAKPLLSVVEAPLKPVVLKYKGTGGSQPGYTGNTAEQSHPIKASPAAQLPSSVITRNNMNTTVILQAIFASAAVGTVVIASVLVYNAAITANAQEEATAAHINAFRNMRKIDHGTLYGQPNGGGLIAT